MLKLTHKEIQSYCIQVGFPKELAAPMSAIAYRESSGDSMAFNGNALTGDRSYGLFQINLFNNTVLLMKLFGITDEKQLFDPLMNCKAAFKLWGNSNRNLDIAWYITRSGKYPNDYRERWEKYLGDAVLVSLGLLNENIIS